MFTVLVLIVSMHVDPNYYKTPKTTEADGKIIADIFCLKSLHQYIILVTWLQFYVVTKLRLKSDQIHAQKPFG